MFYALARLRRERARSNLNVAIEPELRRQQ
jgi:hypothetical protein